MVDPGEPSAAPAADGLDATGVTRGVARMLVDRDLMVLAELPLANGRRADLVALDRTGRITLVEVKSCRADFRADRKWRDYLDYGDRFYFAVAAGFPTAILPAEAGLVVADGFTAEIVREAPLRPLGPARRKAVLIRFGRVAAARLHGLLDPRLER